MVLFSVGNFTQRGQELLDVIEMSCVSQETVELETKKGKGGWELDRSCEKDNTGKWSWYHRI